MMTFENPAVARLWHSTVCTALSCLVASCGGASNAGTAADAGAPDSAAPACVAACEGNVLRCGDDRTECADGCLAAGSAHCAILPSNGVHCESYLPTPHLDGNGVYV